MIISKNKTFLILIALLLAALSWASAAQATTIDFSGNTYISISIDDNDGDDDDGVIFYKTSMNDGYNNPAATSSRAGIYDPDGTQHELIKSGYYPDRDADASVSFDGITDTASSIYSWDKDDSEWIYTSQFDLQTTDNGFSSQYAENSMDLYFYAETSVEYTFTITINWLYAISGLSSEDDIDYDWYSGLTIMLNDTPLTETSLLDLSGKDSISFTVELSKGGWYTLYIGSYMQQSTAPVPEPATLFLLGVGMFGLGISRKFKRN